MIILYLVCKGGSIGQLQKLWERIKNNPKTVRFEELDKLLIKAGFRKRQSGKCYSHFVYIKDEKFIVVPFFKPYIKAIYVERAISLMNDYFNGNKNE
jgi:hypothetical protein